MNFDLSPEESKFREEIRQFIRKNLTPDIRHPIVYAGTLDTPARREFVTKMAEKGWLKFGFPKEYGGDGTPNVMAKFILSNELVMAGAPIVGKNLGQICGALLLYGSEELKKIDISHYLRRGKQWQLQMGDPRFWEDELMSALVG